MRDRKYLPHKNGSTDIEAGRLTVLYVFLQEPIKPLEKRALNFLVNEFLLKNNYKLTSITFSDENDDQVKFTFLKTVIYFFFLTYNLLIVSFIYKKNF